VALVAATGDGLVLIDREVATTVYGGADVRCLAAGDGRLVAGTQDDGVLLSEDAGRTWRRAGLDGQAVKALAINGQTVWAGTKPPRLFVSRDAGGTWTELPAFARMRRRFWRQPAERPSTPYVSALAAPASDPHVVVAGIEAFKLLRSDDGGASWRRLGGRGIPMDAHELTLDARGRMLLAAGFGAAVSDDDGATWSRLTAGLDRRYGFCIAPGFAEPGSAFIAAAPMRSAHTPNARACIFRLRESSWEKLTDELEQLPYGLATSAAHPGHVYAGLGDGTILHSRDDGQSWHAHPVRVPGLRRLRLI
jgi:photosystem II stability/assembly factor-like uncharacterized protein